MGSSFMGYTKFAFDDETQLEFFDYVLEIGFSILAISNKTQKEMIISKEDMKYYNILKERKYGLIVFFKQNFLNFSRKELIREFLQELRIEKLRLIKKTPYVEFYSGGINDGEKLYCDGDMRLARYYPESEEDAIKYEKLLDDYKKIKSWINKHTKLVNTYEYVCDFNSIEITKLRVSKEIERLIKEKGYMKV